MAWVKHGSDATNIYWRRDSDGHVIGFNRRGIGVPFSDEDAPPADIDVHAPPVSVESAANAELESLRSEIAKLKLDIEDIKKGGK